MNIKYKGEMGHCARADGVRRIATIWAKIINIPFPVMQCIMSHR